MPFPETGKVTAGVAQPGVWAWRGLGMGMLQFHFNAPPDLEMRKAGRPLPLHQFEGRRQAQGHTG